MVPLGELLLYEAARSQHVREVIGPLLKKGGVVLCDRFSDATIAYQGYGRGVDTRLIKKLNHLSSRGIKPDVTFLLDCPSDVGLKRALLRNRTLKGEKEDRFEREKVQFHHQVRRGYLSIAKKEPHRVKVIDTREGVDKTFEKIRRIVDKLIIAKRRPIWKHQIPSTCLRRSGFAQAGQISNKFQSTKFETKSVW
jgi:dTMP kinase